jgi:hypothetical protein
LEAVQYKYAALRGKYNDMRLESSVVAGEISRHQALMPKLFAKIAKLKTKSIVADDDDDLHDTSATTIFSRSDTPVDW